MVASTRGEADEGRIYMERIFITGANRGLGLELVRQYMARPQTRVIATCRRPTEALDLIALAREHPQRLTILQLDVASAESIAHAASELSQTTDALDLLINNAGINPSGAAYRQLGHLDGDAITSVIHTNAVGPLLLTQSLESFLQKGHNPRVVMVSSQMGSMDFVRNGGGYAYRMSKAAMNMAARALAGDLGGKGIIVITLHPGWVQTDMGGANATLTVSESAQALLKLFDKLAPTDNGRFFKWTGEQHAW